MVSVVCLAPSIPMDDDPEIRALRKQIQRNPHDPGLRLRLASALVDRDRAKEALAEVQRARQSTPHRPAAMNLQGRIYRLLGREGQ